MKGILLAGGTGSRLYPITKGVCKQMLPIYDKPLVYYPLSVLMLAGIKDILVISTQKDVPRFQDLLGDGTKLGIQLTYKVQDEPRGIADSFIVGEEFIEDDNVCLILGDNIFYGHGLPELLREAASLKDGAIVFRYYVKNPQQYGVINFDESNKVISITEKPDNPQSKWVIPGIYFFDNKVVNIAKAMKPSVRQELEITDVMNEYLNRSKLKCELLGRGYAWLDTGTYESLIDSSMFIKAIEDRQGLKVGCIEEVAYQMGYIDSEQLLNLAAEVKTSYGEYLKEIISRDRAGAVLFRTHNLKEGTHV